MGIGIFLTKSFKGLNSPRYLLGTPVSGDKVVFIVLTLGAIPFNLDNPTFSGIWPPGILFITAFIFPLIWFVISDCPLNKLLILFFYKYVITFNFS